MTTEEKETSTKLEDAVTLLDRLLEESKEAIRRLQQALRAPLPVG